MNWNDVVSYKNFSPKKSTFIKKNKYNHYSIDFLCFDSETSHNHSFDDKDNFKCWVYQWCFYYQGKYIIGRNICDFIKCLKKISEQCTLPEQRHLIFIHNLSYDIEYLKDFLFDNFDASTYKILAVAPHKFISFTIDHFEFRCTYKLSNRSLDKWSKDNNTHNKKYVGAIDYDKIRYIDSPLTLKDWKYQILDVIVLKESIDKEIEINNYKYAIQLPLTSTSYVRQDARKEFKKNYSVNRRNFSNRRLTVEQYLFVKNAFMGGLTHANRFILNQTINKKIKHRDFVSHYPSQQICKYFPVGKFNFLGSNLSFDDLTSYIDDYCLLLKITFQDLHLKNKKITLPYISYSKVKDGKRGILSNVVQDNGRVLTMNGFTTLCLTELDLQIILKQYDFTSYNIDIAYASEKGKLPDWLINLINDYFYKKSYYKEELHNFKTLENEINLMLSKNKLNGIYGMTATDIVRLVYNLSIDGEWSLEQLTPDIISEKLDNYYKSKNNFMDYQFGCWTTAHARFQLIEFVELIGYENYLYCDTDSIFYITNKKIEQKLNRKNLMLKVENDKNKYYIETKNKRYYYNQFELEDEDIRQFRTLHSKCYAYVTSDKKLHCVIAGVQKISNNVSRETELGTIDNLKPNKKFIKCGGTRAIYVPRSDKTNSGVIITKTEKTLSAINEDIYNIYDLED